MAIELDRTIKSVQLTIERSDGIFIYDLEECEVSYQPNFTAARIYDYDSALEEKPTITVTARGMQFYSLENEEEEMTRKVYKVIAVNPRTEDVSWGYAVADSPEKATVKFLLKIQETTKVNIDLLQTHVEKIMDIQEDK